MVRPMTVDLTRNTWLLTSQARVGTDATVAGDDDAANAQATSCESGGARTMTVFWSSKASFD